MVAKILAQFYERVVGPLPDIVRPPSAPAGGVYGGMHVDPPAAAAGADDGGGVGLGGMMSSSRLSNGGGRPLTLSTYFIRSRLKEG